jgi:GntR family transcriptional regulator/MocR family aminotransferase
MSSIIGTTFTLDREASVPLNEQIYQQLRSLIGRSLRPGDALPPSRELAKTLGVGRVTVTTAYRRLEDEGFVEASPGRGTVVSSFSPVRRAETWKSAAPDEGTPAMRPALSPERLAAAEEAAAYYVQKIEPLAVISPDYDSLPGKKWTQIVARISKSPWQHNSYAEPGGYGPYRRAVAEYVRKTRGIACEPEQVIATNGIQQGLSLCLSLLFKPGDLFAVENPGFEPHRLAAQFAGLRLAGVGVDADGLSTKELAALPEAPRGVLVTPSHQYPTGALMNLGRRRELLAWAREHGAWLIEDDYDSELRYNGAPTPALAALDAQGASTVYLGSFTKMIYPGFRLGYLIAPPSLAKAFAGMMLMRERHVSEVHQCILTEFIIGGWYGAHIRRLKNLYVKRRQCAIRALGRHCQRFGHLIPSNQGTHLTFVFDIAVDDAALSAFLRRERRLETRPLSPCYLGAPKASGLLLGFAGFTPSQIETAVAELEEGIEIFLRRQD